MPPETRRIEPRRAIHENPKILVGSTFARPMVVNPRHPRAALTLLIVASFAVACSTTDATSGAEAGDASTSDVRSETGGGNEAGGGADASDANAQQDADAGSCTESLASAAQRNGCPATHPSAQDLCNGDGSPLTKPIFASCGGLDAVVFSAGTHFGLCLYSGGSLVGAQAESDISEFCGNTAYVISGGNVPPACTYPWVRSLEAPDSGATACSANDAGDASTD